MKKTKICLQLKLLAIWRFFHQTLLEICLQSLKGPIEADLLLILPENLLVKVKM